MKIVPYDAVRSPLDEWKSCSQFLHYIVDASRLDLSSPAQTIPTSGLMNQTPTIEFILRRAAIFTEAKKNFND
jgi:hypothetical protein